MRAVWLCLILPFCVAATAARADADALWRIVHERCAPALAAGRGPGPCAAVAYPGGEASGYALLKDRVGVAQFLLIPTARITGIEDPAILAPQATNYWAAAWAARGLVFARLGWALPRDALALAVNSRPGRSQNQLHIHIDCLRADVRDALRAARDGIGPAWEALPGGLAGHPYRARRLLGDLRDADPFRLLAQSVGAARLGRHTLVAAGAKFADGEGFILLDDDADHSLFDRASGEELQDHDCALARLPPN